MTDDDSPRRPRLQRKRLGRIVRFVLDKHFGFIDAEDFRDDVFFHEDIFEPTTVRRVNEYGESVGDKPMEGLWVEFEIDDEHFENEKMLRAKVVRPTDRPAGRKLSGRDATFRIVTHHPKARRKRPTWRKKDD